MAKNKPNGNSANLGFQEKLWQFKRSRELEEEIGKNLAGIGYG